MTARTQNTIEGGITQPIQRGTLPPPDEPVPAGTTWRQVFEQLQAEQSGPTEPGTQPVTESTQPVTQSTQPTTQSTQPVAESDSSVAEPVDLNIEGATLIAVRTPSGGRTWYVEYQVYGVPLRYEIGDDVRATELGIITAGVPGLGPLEAQFDTRITLTQAEFNNRAGLDVGLIDERFGVDETLQESIDRELRIFGKEDLPPWLASSPEAMTIVLQGSIEGWSEGRVLQELSGTAAFRQAFPEFDAFRSQYPNQTITQALTNYTAAREQIRESLRTWRGPDADLSDQFIGGVLAQGWDPDQVENLLIGEATIRSLGAGAVDAINQILEYQGVDAIVTPENLLDFVLPGETQRTPFQLQELINDAIRSQAFATQGIMLSAELASALGPDTEFSTLDPNVAGQIAQETARQIFMNSQELAAEREGLTREDLIRALVDGDQSAAVTEKLAKFARRRQFEAGGFTGGQAFLGERQQLRIAGFTGL